jgi:CheY-like chemotaxis protein
MIMEGVLRSAENANATTPPVIAIIEDDPLIVQLLDDLLRQAGYVVINYRRGDDAQQFVHRTLPDLIILDLCLEDRDAGGMVLGLLELDPLVRHIPVIVCSAHVRVLREHAERFQAKGHRVVPKPFQPAVLLAEVQAALGQRG